MFEDGLGERIKKFRTDRRMTLAVLAERIGVTTSAIASYENESRTPSVDVLIKMARIFTVSVDTLLGLDSGDKVYLTELTDEQKDSVREMIRAYMQLNIALIIIEKQKALADLKSQNDKLTAEDD